MTEAQSSPAARAFGDLPDGFGGVDEPGAYKLPSGSNAPAAAVTRSATGEASTEASGGRIYSHANIDLAFLAAQREFEEVVKDKTGTVDGRSYGYASLHNVIDTLRPIVNRHGMTLTHPTAFKDVSGRAWLIVTATLTHANTGQTKTAEWPVAAGLVHPQQLAALNTMARRQATLSLLGAAPEESDADAADPSGSGSSAPTSSTQVECSPAPDDGPQETIPAATPPEVVADVRKHMSARHEIDAALTKVETEADIEAILGGEWWADLPRGDRAAFEDKIEVLREQIKAGGGSRTPPRSRRAAIAEHQAAKAEASAEAERADPNADAKLFTSLSMSLAKAKGKDALAAWAREATPEKLAKLNALQRESLEQTYRKKAKRTLEESQA